MSPENEQAAETGKVTLRCPFCLTLNAVEVARSGDRPVCGKCSRPMLLDRPVKVSSEDFKRTVLEAGVPVIVDFYADWCAPCKILAPTIDEIAAQNQGRLLVAKVDTDKAQDLALQYQIRGVPTVILFRDGNEVERTWGIEPEKLQSMVEQAA